MLAGVKLVGKAEAERLEREEKKKKKKEKRKHKKQHRKHKHRSDHDDSGSSQSEGERSDDGAGGAVGGAAPAETGSPAVQREDWMTAPARRPAAAAPQEEVEGTAGEKAAPQVRELNPHYQNGGPGLPPDPSPCTVPAGGAPPQPASRAAPAVIGDGGASWRLKALRRSQAQAAEAGKSVGELVSERWGSLGELTAGISAQRPAHVNAHQHAARTRRGDRDQDASARPGYLDDVRSARSQMRRPSDGHESLSWRAKPSTDAAGDERKERKEGDGRRAEGADRAATFSGSRDDSVGASNQERRRQHDAGGAGQSMADAKEERRGGREGERQRQPEQPQRGREGSGRGREGSGRGREREGPRQSVAAVLQASAAELNTFSSDGSFMQHFTSQQQQQGEGSPAQGRASAHAQHSREVSASPAPRDREEEQGEEGGRQRQLQALRPSPPAAPAATGGNAAVAAALRARLTGRPAPTAPPAPPAEVQKIREAPEAVALPLVDAAGRAAPGAFGRETAAAKAAGVRPSKRVERYEGGEKRRYFADDDAVDLATLVKRTKYEGAGDMDATLARNIARRSRFKATDLDPDAEYDHDAGLDLADSSSQAASKAARRRGSGAEEAAVREKARQVREYSKFSSALERCSLCFASPARPKHLVLAMGTCTYLALPPRGRLAAGHCQIVPAEHVASTRAADDAVWTEVRNFKKCLIQMNMAAGRECVFVETALRLGDARSHAVVDCVPLPPEAASKAPMYFRKAVDDATSEWAQHHAKRFIDTAAKGLRGAIPPNFAYLNVEFGLGTGFVHPIDDEERFDRSLARSVLIGLLGLPQEDMHRRAKQQSVAMQTQWAAQFRRDFEQFDWTKALE